MSEVTPYPIDDTEYCTPAQAAEIRRMKAELPLWQNVIEATPEIVTPLFKYTPSDVELHRAINGTTGQESEA